MFKNMDHDAQTGFVPMFVIAREHDNSFCVPGIFLLVGVKMSQWSVPNIC